jgi:pyruvate dehydrogenase E2 component (dihydrolipoamide acetyltransferase)
VSDILMPRLSDSMAEGTIARWLKAEGDQVVQGEQIVEIETDKATMGYEADEDGPLSIVAHEGSTVPVGAVIGRIGSVSPAGGAPAEQSVAVASGAATAMLAPPSSLRRRTPQVSAASPVARRAAASLGVELSMVSGSGAHGRILKRDVGSAAEEVAAAPVTNGRSVATAGGLTIQPLTRTQALIAERMVHSRSQVPQFQVEVEVDMSEAIAVRKRLADLTEAAPSINDLLVKAAAIALTRHPRVNGSFSAAGFVLHHYVNVGVAVAVDGGLLVPTVRSADVKSLCAIAAETRDMAARARAGRITPSELDGATFTVSNLGMLGVARFEAIINAPQAAILGVGAALPRVVNLDGEITTRPTMTLTLSCDHRIIYGADAAAFLSDLRGLLEEPLTLVG